jgi:predicted glutamine amidotransferase
MCGLVGMVGTLEHKHKAAMFDLFFLDTLRGRDSTGLSVVDKNNNVLTRKMTVPGYEFIEFPVVRNAMSHHDRVWMGHNRFKTTGDVSRANAHPFEVLDTDGDVLLVGAHNGTLHNKYALEDKLKEKFETDSEALFNWFAEAHTYKDAVAALRGAWSLTWWDPTTDTFHFLRNAERPMTYAYTKDRKVLVYASEPWMIINACRRNGIELDANEKGLSCAATNIDTLYTLDLPEGRDKELPELRREVGFTGAPVNNFRSSNYWWGEGYDDPNVDEKPKKAAEKGTEKATTARAPYVKPPVTTLVSFGNVKGFNGKFINDKDYADIKAKGCGWCGDELESGMVVAWMDEETLVCNRCMLDTHPRGSVRPDDYDADLDDDIPFNLTEAGAEQQRSEESEEGKKIIARAVKEAVG